jgi:hypothetical protein
MRPVHHVWLSNPFLSCLTQKELGVVENGANESIQSICTDLELCREWEDLKSFNRQLTEKSNSLVVSNPEKKKTWSYIQQKYEREKQANCLFRGNKQQ